MSEEKELRDSNIVQRQRVAVLVTCFVVVVFGVVGGGGDGIFQTSPDKKQLSLVLKCKVSLPCSYSATINTSPYTYNCAPSL